MSKPPRSPIVLPALTEPPAPLPMEGYRPPGAKPESARQTEWKKASTRVNRKGVAFYLSPEAYRQLGRLSLDTDRTLQALMVEAVDGLFQKYSLPRLAGSEEGEGTQ